MKAGRGGGRAGHGREAAVIERREMEAGEPARSYKASELPSLLRGQQVRAAGARVSEGTKKPRWFMFRTEA